MKSTILSVVFSLFFYSLSFGQNSNYVPAGNEGWLVNIEEAYSESEKTGKPIMANFTGSDWCGWCKRLSAEVFKKKDFQDWASENVVLLELDYPRRKQLADDQKAQNYELQKAFQVTGFPTIWLFELEKDQVSKKFQISALGKTGYIPGGSSAFTTQVDQMIAQAKSSK